VNKRRGVEEEPISDIVESTSYWHPRAHFVHRMIRFAESIDLTENATLIVRELLLYRTRRNYSMSLMQLFRPKTMNFLMQMQNYS
jgi:hypothetical protein